MFISHICGHCVCVFYSIFFLPWRKVNKHWIYRHFLQKGIFESWFLKSVTQEIIETNTASTDLMGAGHENLTIRLIHVQYIYLIFSMRTVYTHIKPSNTSSKLILIFYSDSMMWLQGRVISLFYVISTLKIQLLNVEPARWVSCFV